MRDKALNCTSGRRDALLVIAEAGVNHNGSVQQAERLIRAAKASGADVVKFQLFDAELLASPEAEMASYQKKSSKSDCSQQELLKSLELSRNDFQRLKVCCDENKIEFLCTAFDIESLIFLVCDLGCARIKVASGELTNKPFLKAVAKFNKPVLLSTGMATEQEVAWAVDVLISSGLHLSNLTIMHCVTNYPAQPNELNLLAIKSLAEKFSVTVGYSDHSIGVDAPIAALALGAVVLEKHITLDKFMEGPDHRASMPPNDFKDMVRRLRVLETSLGDGVKKPTNAEKENIRLVRKSVVAKVDILEGETLSQSNVTVKRPGTGIPAMYFDEVLGKPANRDYRRDEMVDPICIKPRL